MLYKVDMMMMMIMIGVHGWPKKIDRYKARPTGNEFDTMCLAKFCSRFIILAASKVEGTKTSPYLFELNIKLDLMEMN